MSPIDTIYCGGLEIIYSPVILYTNVVYTNAPCCRHWIPLDALTRSHNESRHLIGRTTTVLHRRYRLLLRFNIIVASPLDMECRPSRLIDTSFMMLLIPNILTPFNSKNSAVSEPLEQRSWIFTLQTSTSG